MPHPRVGARTGCSRIDADRLHNVEIDTLVVVHARMPYSW